MIELPDDELDKLFRKSSEELDPIYEPNDWNDLRSRLDEGEGIRPAALWRKWWPLGLLLIGISVGGFLYNLKGSHTAETKAKLERQGVGMNSVPDERKKIADARVNGNERVAPSEFVVVGPERGKSLEIPKDKEDKTKSSTGRILPPSRSKAGGVYLEPNRSSGKVGEGAFLNSEKSIEKTKEAGRKERLKSGPPVNVGHSDQRIATKKDSRTKSGISIERTTGLQPASVVPSVVGANGNASVEQSSAQVNNHDRIQETVQSERSLLTIDPQMLRPRFSRRNGPVLPGVEALESEKVIQKEEFAKAPEPLFAVRFSYAPDMSTVGLKNFSRPGAAVSLMGEYALFKKMYLQTGVIWSNKIYSAPGSAYQIPKEPHDYGPAPAGVDGQCKVFELPLNIRYDIFQGRYFRWFAGAGSTSYHMNSEAYKYRFENENDPKIKYRAWQGSTGWYLFSHLNASTGYEYMLTKRLSLIAEPYIRIPLKRVGYGKANLFTTGAWISVRYTPVFKRN